MEVKEQEGQGPLWAVAPLLNELKYAYIPVNQAIPRL
jgi:hypothetical protein